MSVLRRVTWVSLACCAMLVATDAALAQATTELRTRDGRTFFVEGVQIRGTTMVFQPRGLGILEVPVTDVLCLGTECAKLAITPPAPQAAAGVSTIAIHGSNTIGATLMPGVLRKFGESLPGGNVDVEFAAIAEEQTLRFSSNEIERLVVNLASHGSGTSFKSLLAGTAAIGMSSRAIKPDEAAALREKYGQDMLDAASEHVVGLDGLAVIVNQANPIKSKPMSIETIAQIFAGEITDWDQLGGTPGPIKVHARDDKSGTYDTFADLVLKANKKVISPTAARYESSEQITDQVERDPAAIGFIGFAYVRNNYAVAISGTCSFASPPSQFVVQTEVYPLARRLYLYTLGTPTDPWAKRIVNFALSDAAQSAVRESGFIDQSINAEDPQLKELWLTQMRANAELLVPSRIRTQFDTVVKSIDRTSVAFRFAPSSINLDNKAKTDIRRAARFLKRRENAGRSFYVVGFSDISGQMSANVALSRERARAVAALLAAEGVPVADAQILAFGPAGAIACNNEERGRAINRRVELWLDTTGKPRSVPATAATGALPAVVPAKVVAQ